MLVTFKCRHYHNIVMFGDVGIALLKLMGKSGSVPGTLRADEAAETLTQLRASLEGKAGDTPTASEGSDDDDKNEKPAVSLRQRAMPLIEMLSVAAERECDILWE